MFVSFSVCLFTCDATHWKAAMFRSFSISADRLCVLFAPNLSACKLFAQCLFRLSVPLLLCLFPWLHVSFIVCFFYCLFLLCLFLLLSVPFIACFLLSLTYYLFLFVYFLQFTSCECFFLFVYFLQYYVSYYLSVSFIVCLSKKVNGVFCFCVYSVCQLGL